MGSLPLYGGTLALSYSVSKTEVSKGRTASGTHYTVSELDVQALGGMRARGIEGA